MEANDCDSSSSMTAAPSSITRRQPMRRSCEVCRASKSRCLPAEDGTARCQKCVKDGKECVFKEALARPKRIRTSKARVAELEQKLDGLLDLLSAKNADTTISPPSSSSTITPPSQHQPPPVDPINFIDPLSSTQPFDVDDVIRSMLPLPSPIQFPGQISDAIGKGIIDIGTAERQLSEWDEYFPHFPFVVLPPNHSLDDMRREKPFLLLSILAVTSNGDLRLQERLETELKAQISERVITQCDRNLDIIQGLMIYLAWYHYFFQPFRHQIYQMLQLAISLVVDLGLTKPGLRVGGLPLYGYLEDEPSVRSATEVDIARTVLGCFFLSSSLSITMRKPNTLRYNDHIGEHCKYLDHPNASSSDRSICYLTAIQHVADDVDRTFDYNGYGQLSSSCDAMHIEALVKAFRQQLKQVRDGMPLEFLNNIPVKMAYVRAQAYINEIGFNTSPYDMFAIGNNAPTNQPVSTRDWYQSLSRAGVLLSALESAKLIVDEYVALPNEMLRRHTFMDQSGPLYAFLVLGQTTVGIGSPHIDTNFLRDNTNMMYYIEVLLEKTNAQLVYHAVDGGQPQPDHFCRLSRIIQASKSFLELMFRSGSFVPLKQICEPEHYLMLSPVKVLQVIPEFKILEAEAYKSAAAAAAATEDMDQMWTTGFDTNAYDGFTVPTLDSETVLNGA